MPYLRSLAALLLLLPTLARAADPAPDADGFTPLFNGRDLAGWVPVNAAPNTFSVRDGMIYCTGVPTGVMRTDRMYENFIVELDWRHLTPNGNSGFFLWADAITSRGVPFTRAIEVQVLDGPGAPDDAYTTHGDVFAIHGATLTPGNPGKWAMRAYPTEHRSNPSPQWNHYRIECRDGSIALAVNGKVVTTARDASPRRGYLCLESEGGQIEFRNLRIKELPPGANLDPKHVARAAEGYISLYTGVDLAHFTTPTPAAWQPKDWTLHCDPPEPNHPARLTTADKFADVDFILDVRQDAPAPITLIVRDAAVPLDLTKLPAHKGKKPAWHRIEAKVRQSTLALTLDGAAQPEAVHLPNATPASIAIEATTPTDFANLYVKVLTP